MRLIAAVVAIDVHHEKREGLCELRWDMPLIMWTVDVQVVIDLHLHSVIILQEPLVAVVPVHCMPGAARPPHLLQDQGHEEQPPQQGVQRHGGGGGSLLGTIRGTLLHRTPTHQSE